jgi:hypothetical protein
MIGGILGLVALAVFLASVFEERRQRRAARRELARFIAEHARGDTWPTSGSNKQAASRASLR